MPDPNPSQIRDGSVKDLVSGIVSDTRELLGAHVDAIRRESRESLDDLAASMRAAALAAAAMVVTLIAVSHALAITLIRLGLVPWASYWLVAVAAAGIAGLMLLRARNRAKHSKGHPKDALKRARHDAAWVAERAGDVA